MSKLRKKVYIAGPITLGSREFNFDQSIIAQRTLMLAGFAPLNPMLTLKFPNDADIPHQVWMDSDLPWVAVADAVLRLPGASKGADMETAFAISQGVPVFTDLSDLIDALSADPNIEIDNDEIDTSDLNLDEYSNDKDLDLEDDDIAELAIFNPDDLDDTE